MASELTGPRTSPQDSAQPEDGPLSEAQLTDFMGPQEPLTEKQMDAIRHKMAIKGSRIAIHVAVDPNR